MNYPAIPREFFNGDCFDAYRILGAHPCTAPDGAVGWHGKSRYRRVERLYPGPGRG